MSPDRTRPADAWSVGDLRAAVRAAGVALWSWNVGGDCLTMDERAYDLWGVPQSDHVAFEKLSARIHPADRDRVRAAFEATRAVVGSYEIDFRILVGETVRWISARGQGDDAGSVAGVVFGVFLDVTDRKQAEEANELLAGEMGHRVKNLLAIASGLTTMTWRSAKSTEAMARDLTSRLAALGRAHDLVRPVPGKGEGGALLGDLLSILLAPYDDHGAFSGRIRIAVPRMRVGEVGATCLAMVVHEFATNAVKYGALSRDAGTLDVSCTSGERDVILIWTERGGPTVDAPSANGFGSRLITRSISAHLRGSVHHDWCPEGLIATVRMEPSRLSL